jgi:nucleoside-diphosphate-sugar epimerase
MRVVVVGGTRFFGRAVLWELVGSGHELLLVHRGVHEPEDLPDVPHLHGHRRDLAGQGPELRSFRPEAVVDLCAMTGDDAEGVLEAVGTGVRLLVAPSIDVYRAYASVMSGVVTDTVPLDEQAPRTGPPPDRDYVAPGFDYDPARYEKLDAEAAYLARAGTVCRLPMIYGEHDYKHLEEFILRRVRAGRERIPVGRATWLWSRGQAPDLAAGMRPR